MQAGGILFSCVFSIAMFILIFQPFKRMVPKITLGLEGKAIFYFLLRTEGFPIEVDIFFENLRNSKDINVKVIISLTIYSTSFPSLNLEIAGICPPEMQGLEPPSSALTLY